MARAVRSTSSTKQLAEIAAAAIADGAPITTAEKEDRTTKTGTASGIQSPLMAASAVQEIADRELEDADSVAAHVERLTGGVKVADFEKALHTVASFLALPVRRVDPRTGEIVTFDMGRGEVEQVLNAVCYSAARLLNADDDFSSIAKCEKARQRVLRDQRALSEGNEIDEVEARRNMDSLDYREVIVNGVREAQAVAERVYHTRTGKDFKRPTFRPRGNVAKVTDADTRNQLLAEMAKRTGIAAQRVEGDAPFDMATQSADPSQR